MKNVMRTLLTLTLTLGLCASAFADTKVHPSGGVSIDVPESWSSSVDGDVLVIQADDDTVGLMLAVLDAGDLDAALDAVDEEIGKHVTGLELGEPEKSEINGMAALLVDGKGKANGADVEVGVAIVEAPSGKVVLLFGMAASESLAKHEAAVAGIIGSIKPAK